MARAGEIVENPITGERIVFRGTGAREADDVFRADLFLRAYGPVASPHVHLRQDEHVEVMAGKIRCRLGREDHPLGARQTLTVPAGSAHVVWNDGDSEAHVALELRPTRDAGALFGELARLAREGKTDEHGMPYGIDLAILGERFGFFAAGMPLAAQRPIAKGLASLARALRLR